MATVLVVEDDVRLATLIAEVLEEDGHAVLVAHDGEQALSEALASPIDVIVLDVMLPSLDGVTVCRRLREAQRPAAVLLLTALGAVEDRVLGLDAGADDYLVKPFAMAELCARVRALARRPAGLRSPELRVADLVISPLRHEAWRDGQRLELTAREFSLLAFLARHAGEAMRREDIIDAVWGEDAELYGNVIDRCIHHLRTKTEQHGPRLIETVRGVGYILCDPKDAQCSLLSVSG
jgi:DNA-binding response OmpR family regulator